MNIEQSLGMMVEESLLGGKEEGALPLYLCGIPDRCSEDRSALYLMLCCPYVRKSTNYQQDEYLSARANWHFERRPHSSSACAFCQSLEVAHRPRTTFAIWSMKASLTDLAVADFLFL